MVRLCNKAELQVKQDEYCAAPEMPRPVSSLRILRARQEEGRAPALYEDALKLQQLNNNFRHYSLLVLANFSLSVRHN